MRPGSCMLGLRSNALAVIRCKKDGTGTTGV